MGKCFLNLWGNIFQSCFREGITVGNYSFKIGIFLKIAVYPKTLSGVSLAAFLRSPLDHPIWTQISHLASWRLCKQSLEPKIQYESYEAFCQVIRKTLLNFPVVIIDRTISLVHIMLDATIKLKGQHTQY